MEQHVKKPKSFVEEGWYEGFMACLTLVDKRNSTWNMKRKSGKAFKQVQNVGVGDQNEKQEFIKKQEQEKARSKTAGRS